MGNVSQKNPQAGNDKPLTAFMESSTIYHLPATKQIATKSSCEVKHDWLTHILDVTAGPLIGGGAFVLRSLTRFGLPPLRVFINKPHLSPAGAAAHNPVSLPALSHSCSRFNEVPLRKL